MAWSPFEVGGAYVAARWDRMVVISTYISPNIGRADFEDALERIAACILRAGDKPVLLGATSTPIPVCGGPLTLT